MERESFKLVLACFLKLSFFCVFVGDFCSPPRSSGLAPNKGHEKRWHLGMARLLHGRTGHWWLCEHVSSAFKRHVRYAPAFLSLNKKQAKSHDILKAKRLGSIERNKLGLQNRLDPEALRLSMVPNINILLLLVQGAPETNDFWHPKT